MTIEDREKLGAAALLITEAMTAIHANEFEHALGILRAARRAIESLDTDEAPEDGTR